MNAVESTAGLLLIEASDCSDFGQQFFEMLTALVGALAGKQRFHSDVVLVKRKDHSGHARGLHHFSSLGDGNVDLIDLIRAAEIAESVDR
jgi:hypothetical protein